MMTFYHFGNCLALAYVPYYLLYRHAGLSEYGAFWKCVSAGAFYMGTQLLKMLFLATFFPVMGEDVGGDEVEVETPFVFFTEFLKVWVGVGLDKASLVTSLNTSSFAYCAVEIELFLYPRPMLQKVRDHDFLLPGDR